jgi:hypothetical protein
MVSGRPVEALESRKLLSVGVGGASADVAAVDAADVTPPTASILSEPSNGGSPGTPVPRAGMGSHEFQIVYADNTYNGMNNAVLRPDGVTVRPPGGDAAAAVPAVLLSVFGPWSVTNSVIATYRVAAPGGAFDPADDGAYTVHVAAGTVSDLAGNGILEGDVGTFTADLSPPPDGTQGADVALAIEVPAPSAPLAPGAWSRVTVVLTNRGADPAEPSGVELVASSDAVRDLSDPVLTTRGPWVRKLMPGQSRRVTIRFRQVPPTQWGTTLPTTEPYYLIAHADVGNWVPENDETNNVAVQAERLSSAPQAVDLAVGAVGLPAPTRRPPTPGRRAPVPVTVQNLGGTPFRGRVRLDLFASADAVGDATDLQLGLMDVPLKLKAGGHRTVRVPFLYAGALPPGAYFVVAVLDGAGAVPETNESNNAGVSASPFAVQ